ncbi:hypothetical protein MMC20_004225 [Loxospora ochrophaea]|nr:hypothetical protein [Loxospora ochrophaea]
MTACPDDYHYNGAKCKREIDPQAYTVNCTRENAAGDTVEVLYRQDKCTGMEVCGQKRIQVTPRVTAVWCISMDLADYVQVSTVIDVLLPSTCNVAAVDVVAYAIGRDVTFEAFLETMQMGHPVAADHFQIEAREELELFGAKSYKTLPGGVSACTHCQSVELDPVPFGTQDFHLRVELPKGVMAKMYIISL